MKKLVYAALLLSLCLTLTSCGKKEEEKADPSTTEASADTSDEASADSSEDTDTVEVNEPSGASELYNEAGDKCVLVTVPDGFEAQEHMAKSWLGYEKTDGDVLTTLTMYLKDDVDGLENSLIEGINYQASANADDGVTISDVKEVDGTSYFTYSYSVNGTTIEGANMWKTLDNGAAFVLTAEDAGNGAATIDVKSYVKEIINTVKEN